MMMYESLTEMRLKRKYSKQLAQEIYDRYRKYEASPVPIKYPLLSALRALREENEMLWNVHSYAYFHLNGSNWTKARRDIDHVKGFLRALDVITAEALQGIGLSAHEQMMILEEDVRVSNEDAS